VPQDSPEPAPQPPAQSPRSTQPNNEAPTLALLQQSRRSADSGDLDGAIAYVERAIRLSPRDPELWLQLARLQLAAKRPGRAEQIAQKAVALSGRQHDLQRQGWLLVADAREAQGDADGAARIRAEWRSYRG
jgi:predicted Zn-dependent protease